MRQPRVFFLLAGFLLAAAYALAADQVPIKGRFGTTFQIIPLSPTVISVPVTGSGTVSHLGLSTVAISQTVDFAKATGNQVGTFTFMAANGDTVSGTFLGTATPPNAKNIGIFGGTMTITGGTGRFAEVTGSMLYSGMANLNTSRGLFSVSGTISIPDR